MSGQTKRENHNPKCVQDHDPVTSLCVLGNGHVWQSPAYGHTSRPHGGQQVMRFYLVTFHETDGNDTTVYDTIVKVPDQAECDRATNGDVGGEEIAYDKVATAIERTLTEKGIAFTEDVDGGVYFECMHRCATCDRDGACSYDCQGHGGTVMRSAEAFETLEDARKEQAERYYHARFHAEDLD
jgi:hypothetical protein